MDRATSCHRWDGRDRPTFRITYPLRDRPDGTPRARYRFPPRGNTLGRLSLAQGRPVRPHTRTRACPRQRPTRRPSARRTARASDGAPTHADAPNALSAPGSLATSRRLVAVKCVHQCVPRLVGRMPRHTFYDVLVCGRWVGAGRWARRPLAGHGLESQLDLT